MLRALLRRVPGAEFVYLGDTARLPYGAKSQLTIARYAVESARFLAAQGAEHLVIACNTATALALEDIRAAVNMPLTGVIAPGAAAAAEAGAGGDVLVLATAATVQSHAYRETCAAMGQRAWEKACPLLVPLVEEGWIDHDVTREVLRIYLDEALGEMRAAGMEPSAVLLGCTHYPLLHIQIADMLEELGSSAVVVDSAEATAEAVATQIPSGSDEGGFRCYATDSVEKFARLGSRFLGRDIATVELLDLGG